MDGGQEATLRRAGSKGVRCAALCSAGILLFLAFAYHRGADSYLRINDNLDGFIPVYRVLSEHPILGPLDSQVEPVMGGVSRNSLPSALNLGVLPYFVLEPWQAYALMDLVARLVAFAGMALLLRRRVLPDAADPVVFGSALCFALLPFFPAGHLSVAGQPLLLYALLNLREGRGRASDWLVALIFPLYSSLIYIGVFVLGLVGALAAWDLLRSRRVSPALVVALLLMGVLYAGTEYRLLYQTLVGGDGVSFRSEWDNRARPLLQSVHVAVTFFLFSHIHAAAAQFPFIWIAALGALGLELDGARRGGSLREVLSEPLRASAYARPSRRLVLVLLLALCGLLAVQVGLYFWEGTQSLIAATGVTALRMFGFHRLQWFHPLLFGVAFAWSLDLIWHRRAGRAVVALLLCLQLGLLVWNSDSLRVRREADLSYREFYSPALFREIEEHIGRPTAEYRVASFGMMPTIALFNGFYTVDGFLSNYPLEYKRRFRRVIAAELEKDAFLRDIWDKWAAHVHLYSSELGMIVGYRKGGYYTKYHPVRSVTDLRFDAAALRELGCGYVLSAVEIENHAELGLRYEASFERSDSPWQIHLYSL